MSRYDEELDTEFALDAASVVVGRMVRLGMLGDAASRKVAAIAISNFAQEYGLPVYFATVRSLINDEVAFVAEQA